MPRSRPIRQFFTVLAMGEGETEGAFLYFLKSLYDSRYSGIQITVDWMYGGSPSDIISEAIRIKKSASYSRAFLILDTDIEWEAEDCKSADHSDLMLLGSKPCVEALFLQILDDSCNWTTKSTKECKKAFHTKYLSETEKTNSTKYPKHFSKDTIEAARNRILMLDKIIRLLTEIS